MASSVVSKGVCWERWRVSRCALMLSLAAGCARQPEPRVVSLAMATGVVDRSPYTSRGIRLPERPGSRCAANCAPLAARRRCPGYESGSVVTVLQR
jgi:hypothetical protein